jgi:hypothetical protein
VTTPTRFLALDEYDRATREFFSQAVDAVARASDPILGQIQREKVEVIARSTSTMESGEVVQRDPLLSSASISFSVPESIDGDFSGVVTAIADTADQFLATMMPNLFDHISEICDATGNVVSGKDRSIWDSMIEVLETIAISFDAAGNPSLPSIVMHPDTAAKLGDPPEGYEDMVNEIIARRRDEWVAGRRTRRLPRQC